MSSMRALSRPAARRCQTSLRQGLTLVEVLVTIGILGMLLSLLLPTVLRSREAARKVECGQRLKSIGMALLEYEEQHGHYPEVGWIVHLLPHLGQQPLYERLTSPWDEPIGDLTPTWFLCPSDPAPPGMVTNYAINCGFPFYGYNGFFRNHWVSGWREIPLRSADIIDGLSNTVAFAEIIRSGGGFPNRLRTIWMYPASIRFGPDDLEAFSDFVESLPQDPARHGYISGGRSGTWYVNIDHLYHHMLPPNRPSAARAGSPLGRGCFTAVSMHPGGTQALYGDGRVDFISQSIDRATWRDLGSRSPFPEDPHAPQTVR